MFKRIVHKLFSAILALLVLVSTVSFTVEKHYCGDHLIDVAVFSRAKTCGMDMEKNSMTSIEKKHCCKDESEVIKGQDKLKKVSSEDFDFGQQFFILSFIYSYHTLFEGLPTQIIPHKDYSPPNLITDIQILDQVFII